MMIQTYFFLKKEISKKYVQKMIFEILRNFYVLIFKEKNFLFFKIYIFRKYFLKFFNCASFLINKFFL